MLHRHYLAFLWLPVFIAVQSMPHTGAVRTFLLICGVAHLLFLARKYGLDRQDLKQAKLNNPVFCTLFILTLWLIVQITCFASAPSLSIKLFAAEWLKWLFMFGFGYLVALVASKSNPNQKKTLIYALCLAYFIHILAIISYQIFLFTTEGKFLIGYSFFGNYGYVSPFVSALFAILLPELILRIQHQSYLAFSRLGLAFLFVLSCTALVALSAKAATVVCLAMFAISAWILALCNRKAAILVGIALVVFALLGIGVDQRWRGGMSAIQQTLTQTTHDPDQIYIPPLGVTDPSFYQRAMSIKFGIAGIVQHPLGLGYREDAFGEYLKELGGQAGRISSESGWIDFTLANGIPGMLCLLAFFIALMQQGWRQYRQYHNPLGLFLFFFVFHFTLRSLLDGYLYGSRFMMFIFIAGLLFGLLQTPEPRTHDPTH